MDLSHPFMAVKQLYLSEQFAPRIAPALQNVFLEGFQTSVPVHEGIARFISARQLVNHPVAISFWDRGLRKEPDPDPDSEVDD